MRDLDNPYPDLAAMRADYGAVHIAAGQPGSGGDNSGISHSPGLHDAELDETWLAGGWEPLLRHWIEQATAVGIAEPNAMVLATVTHTAETPRPVTRTVLCKGLSPEGVTFYTNYDSAKGAQLTAVPFASATFVWPALGRQVHLRGPVERVPAETTAVYWRSRPRDSQLGAWASHQSRPIASRADLDRALAETLARFADVDDIPVPPHWGGYLLRPDEVEFWQGRQGRLHNRISVRVDGTQMTVQRLQP